MKKRIIEKIEAVMLGKDSGTGYLRIPLYALSRLYWRLISARNLLYDRKIMPIRRLPCKVVSIGNICVGGTGKTPMVMYTAVLLKSMGYRVCVVSRGYKGKAERKGGIVSDGEGIWMDVAAAGDESYMMATLLRGIPVVVGKNRYAAGMTGINRFGAEVVVLDDGFQHRRLFRDVDLVLVDYRRPFGNCRLIPAGLLREPVRAMARSHGIIATRAVKDGGDPIKDTLIRHGVVYDKPVFFTRHEAYVDMGRNFGRRDGHCGKDTAATFVALQSKNIFAFSGIADNQNFLNTLCQYGMNVKGFMGFPDHYRYREEDFRDIAHAAMKKGADAIVTTQKDAVKVPRKMVWPLDFVVIGIHISFVGNETGFQAILREKLGV